MQRLTVYLIDLLGDNRFEVVLPTNVSLGTLLPQLRTQLGLAGGIAGCVQLRRSGQILAADATLQSAGVVEYDTLRLLVSGMADAPSPIQVGINHRPNVHVVGQPGRPPLLPASPFHFPDEHATWGEPDAAAVQVSLSAAAYKRVADHARRSRQAAGGLLLGLIYKASGGRHHLWVADALPQLDSTSGAFQFTPEGWAGLLTQAEQQYVNLRIIGWYQSQPNSGTAFSPADQQLQKWCFATPRVGLVVDQVRSEASFYTCQPDGEVSALPGFYEQLKGGARSCVRWQNFGAPLLPSDWSASGFEPAYDSAGGNRQQAARTNWMPLPQLRRSGSPQHSVRSTLVGDGMDGLILSTLLNNRLGTVERRLAELESRLNQSSE